MGLGSLRWKILLIVTTIIVLWQSSKIWLSFVQNHGTEGKKKKKEENLFLYILRVNNYLVKNYFS